MKRILLIEDDHYLKNNIKELLHKNGYEVTLASNREEADYYIVNNREFDLYIIDIILPDGDGFQICRKIRARNIKPVLFLTACEDEESAVKGLNMGADDYITKPFRAAELISRIQAHLRRLNMGNTADVLSSGKLKFNKKTGIVIVDQKQIDLRPVELSLLQIFLQNSGIIIKRKQLLDKLWDSDGNFVEDNTLSVHICRLRDRLGAPQGQPYIETVRKFGYRWLYPVEEQMDIGEEGSF